MYSSILKMHKIRLTDASILPRVYHNLMIYIIILIIIYIPAYIMDLD